MAEQKTVILDAGHGGNDPGASYRGRKEKDDTWKLTLAVGRMLVEAGARVLYTRVDDSYDTPFEKARIANQSEADYLVSLHRNSAQTPGSESGVESLMFENSKAAALLAENINTALQKVGYINLGVTERPGMALLRRTRMPAVQVEVGFIDNDEDNQLFDQKFQETAGAIAKGVKETMEQEDASRPEYYQVQVGAFKEKENGMQVADHLRNQGFPAFLVHEDGYYKVRVGAFLSLDHAARMEQSLRNMGYPTMIVLKEAI